MDSSGLASFALTMKSGKATANVHALYEEMKIFDSTDRHADTHKPLSGAM